MGLVFQLHCFTLPEIRVNLCDFVFNGGHIDAAINIEIAFSHASRSLNSLYKGLLLRETKFKMAQAICCGGILKFHCTALSLSLSHIIWQLYNPFLCFKLTHKNIAGPQTFVDKHTTPYDQNNWKTNQICKLKSNSQFYWSIVVSAEGTIAVTMEGFGSQEIYGNVQTCDYAIDDSFVPTSRFWLQKEYGWVEIYVKRLSYFLERRLCYFWP